MNEQVLRAYALRGLTARLTELDDERARILVLLRRWDAAAKPSIRRRIRNVSSQSEPVDSPETLAARADSSSLAPAAEIEVARILPRRNRAQARPPAVETAPALPPMPRLVKARAS